MESWLEVEKELAKEVIKDVKTQGLENLIPQLFDSEERLYALAFAMEELKEEGKDFADIEERVLNKNPDYLHHKTIAEAVYDKGYSRSTSSKFGRILKSVGKIALVGLLIGATVYASGCLTNNTTRTTTTTSTSSSIAAHMSTTTQQINEVHDYLMQKNATEYYNLFKPLENKLDDNEKNLIDEFLALPKDIRENVIVTQKINQIVKDSMVTDNEVKSFSDLDGDGFNNTLEVDNGLDPLTKNPNAFYVYNRTKDLNLAKFVLPLDKDGVQDKNEKMFDNILIKDSSLLSVKSYKDFLMKTVVDDKITDAEVNKLNNSSELVNILYNTTVTDREIVNKIDSVSLEFDTLSKLNKYNLTNEQLAYITKFAGYNVDNGKNVYELFSLRDINNTLYLIEKYPIIYTGASKQYPLGSVGTEILTYLVKDSVTESEKYPYLIWALSKSSEININAINSKELPSFFVIDNPVKNFDITNDYGSNYTFVDLIKSRKNQILYANEKDLWLIGLSQKDVFSITGSNYTADLWMLQVTFPFSLVSGDSLKGDWIVYVYPEMYKTQPAKAILLAIHDNIVAMDNFIQFFDDYKNEKIDIEKLVLDNLNEFEKYNNETGRDLKLLWYNGSDISKYNIIIKFGMNNELLKNRYNITPYNSKHEEYRVSMKQVIGASVGIPIYGGFFELYDETYHGTIGVTIDKHDYQLLKNVDSSELLWDENTRTLNIFVTRTSSNYFYNYYINKLWKPYIIEWWISYPVKTYKSRFVDPFMALVWTYNEG